MIRGKIVPKGIVIHSIASFFSIEELLKATGKNFENNHGYIGCEDFLKIMGYGYHCIISKKDVNYCSPPTDEMSSKKEAYKLWHAGLSEWNGHKNLNNHFLGVCFAVDRDEYTWKGYLEAIKKPFSEEQFSLGLNTVRGYIK